MKSLSVWLLLYVVEEGKVNLVTYPLSTHHPRDWPASAKCLFYLMNMEKRQGKTALNPAFWSQNPAAGSQSSLTGPGGRGLDKSEYPLFAGRAHG